MTAHRLYISWKAYHKANPDVWEWFVRLTFRKIHQGFKHYSADAVMHVVRFETNVYPEAENDFKVCNNHVAFYARLFHDTYPDHDKFFRLRKSAADDYFGDL